MKVVYCKFWKKLAVTQLLIVALNDQMIKGIHKFILIANAINFNDTMIIIESQQTIPVPAYGSQVQNC